MMGLARQEGQGDCRGTRPQAMSLHPGWAPLRSLDRARQSLEVHMLKRPGAHSLREELNTDPGGNPINYSPQSCSGLPLIS